MIHIVTNPAREMWDRYATANGAAKISHLSDWAESIAAAYALSLFQLAAMNTTTQQIEGILPLMLFNPPGKETRLISLPYTDAGGMLADDQESGQQLLLAALKLADELGASHLEMRQDGTLQDFFQQHKPPEPWHHTLHNFKTGLIRPIPPSVDALWTALAGKVRNQVRKARRCECTARTGKGELLSDFYAVFSENMRDLGSPVHGLELFRRLLASELLQTAIIVIYLHGRPAAAAVVLQHNETLYNPWASSLRRYRPLCPNMLLYWSMLRYAVVKRCKWFDFGRSTADTPTCRFKLQWGAEMTHLGWHVYSRKPHRWVPENESLTHDSWKRMELAKSRRAGPAIRRWISL